MTTGQKQVPNPLGKRAQLPAGLVPTGVVARRLGMAAYTLRRWVQAGGIKPVRIGHGKGSVYGWRIRDIVAAKAIKKLRQRVSAQHLRRVIAELDRWGEDLSSAVLVADPRERYVYRVLDSERALRVLDGQTRATALAPIRDEVIAAMEEEGYDVAATG